MCKTAIYKFRLVLFVISRRREKGVKLHRYDRSHQRRLIGDFSLFARAVHIDMGYVDLFLVRKWDVAFVKKIVTQFCVLGEYAPQSVVGLFGQRLIGFREVTLCSYYKPGLDPDVDVPSGALVFLQVDLFSTIEVFGGSITLNGFCYHLHEGSWPDGCYSLYEYLRRPFVETERGSFNFRSFSFFFHKKTYFLLVSLSLFFFFLEFSLSLVLLSNFKSFKK